MALKEINNLLSRLKNIEEEAKHIEKNLIDKKLKEKVSLEFTVEQLEELSNMIEDAYKYKLYQSNCMYIGVDDYDRKKYESITNYIKSKINIK